MRLKNNLEISQLPYKLDRKQFCFITNLYAIFWNDIKIIKCYNTLCTFIFEELCLNICILIKLFEKKNILGLCFTNGNICKLNYIIFGLKFISSPKSYLFQYKMFEFKVKVIIFLLSTQWQFFMHIRNFWKGHWKEYFTLFLNI